MHDEDDDVEMTPGGGWWGLLLLLLPVHRETISLYIEKQPPCTPRGNLPASRGGVMLPPRCSNRSTKGTEPLPYERRGGGRGAHSIVRGMSRGRRERERRSELGLRARTARGSSSGACSGGWAERGGG